MELAARGDLVGDSTAGASGWRRCSRGGARARPRRGAGPGAYRKRARRTRRRRWRPRSPEPSDRCRSGYTVGAAPRRARAHPRWQSLAATAPREPETPALWRCSRRAGGAARRRPPPPMMLLATRQRARAEHRSAARHLLARRRAAMLTATEPSVPAGSPRRAIAVRAGGRRPRPAAPARRGCGVSRHQPRRWAGRSRSARGAGGPATCWQRSRPWRRGGRRVASEATRSARARRGDSGLIGRDWAQELTAQEGCSGG